MLEKVKSHRVTKYIFTHKKFVIPAVLIILILLFVFRPKPEPVIETAKVETGNVSQTISGTGTVDSKKSATVGFLSAGKVMYLGAKKGDTVVAGQVLATLDQRSVQKSLESTLRDYSKQRNTFEQTKQNNNPNQPLEAQTDQIRRVLENNQYDLEKAVLSVELQDLAKQNSVLTSPISGVITKSDITTAGVNVGATSTWTVADVDDLIFKIDIDEADIGKVTLAQPVTATLDAYPDEALPLSISLIDFASHSTSTGGTAFTVEAALPMNTNDKFRIGMGGDAEVIINEKRNVLKIPVSSIVDDKYVYVKKSQKKLAFEKRMVTVGLKSDIDAEIKSGLSKDELVAIQPVDVETSKLIIK